MVKVIHIPVQGGLALRFRCNRLRLAQNLCEGGDFRQQPRHIGGEQGDPCYLLWVGVHPILGVQCVCRLRQQVGR